MYYKNISNNVMAFHGVIFEPGDIKSADGFINHKGIIRASEEEIAKLNKSNKKTTTKSVVRTSDNKEITTNDNVVNTKENKEGNVENGKDSN